jgi:hypothetical protein
MHVKSVCVHACAVLLVVRMDYDKLVVCQHLAGWTMAV